MEYITKQLLFKLRKTSRYLRLYGARRTIAKIRGQYHMKRRYAVLPRSAKTDGRSHVGIIGCGNFAFSNIAFYLRKIAGPVIRGAMDIDVNRSASLAEAYRAGYFTTDAERLIQDKSIDLIYISSNHASHAEYAIQALEAGKCVHIEKPHVVSEDQLERLVSVMLTSKSKVGLGFNRPESHIGREIKRYLNTQEGAMMCSWFIAGHAIDSTHWYFNRDEGGRVLGNLCHWTDFVYQMMPHESRFPVVIRGIGAGTGNCNIVATYLFSDQSIATINFSEKQEPFEGVREKLVVHRGDALITMEDFRRLVVEVGSKKLSFTWRRRDHGHEAAIRYSYGMVRGTNLISGRSRQYVWETGQLFLKTKEALENHRDVTLMGWDRSGNSPSV